MEINPKTYETYGIIITRNEIARYMKLLHFILDRVKKQSLLYNIIVLLILSLFKIDTVRLYDGK